MEGNSSVKYEIIIEMENAFLLLFTRYHPEITTNNSSALFLQENHIQSVS